MCSFALFFGGTSLRELIAGPAAGDLLLVETALASPPLMTSVGAPPSLTHTQADRLTAVVAGFVVGGPALIV